MTEPPRISVVLPTYNHLRYLPAAIADIVGQTRRDWELIVVDDGSTDGTGDWLDAEAASGREKRLRVIHQDNAGPHAAINAGVAAARGQYLTWVSADNRCAPYFLEALAAALDCDVQASLAYSPYYGIDENDRVHAIKFDNLLLLRELVTDTPRGMAGFLYRRAIHEQVGEYRGYACDTLMWSRIVEAYATVFVVEPTYYYRFHDDRATVRESGRVRIDRREVTAEFFARHCGALDDAALVRLYPGLAQRPDLAADAMADFAARLSRCGMHDAALRLAVSALERAAPADVLRPLVNAVLAASRAGAEPMEAVWSALEANPGLASIQREAALAIAASLGELAGKTQGVPGLMLDAGHPLCAFDRPKVFSYAAWKFGHSIGPLPAF